MMNKFAIGTVVALVLTLATFTLAGEECMKKIDAYKKQCTTELTLKDDDVKSLDKECTQFTNGTKCLIKCVAENMGVYKDGKIIESVVMNMMTDFQKEHPDVKERDNAVLKECKDITAPCPCETAAKIFCCVKDVSARFMTGKLKKN